MMTAGAPEGAAHTTSRQDFQAGRACENELPRNPDFDQLQHLADSTFKTIYAASATAQSMAC